MNVRDIQAAIKGRIREVESYEAEIQLHTRELEVLQAEGTPMEWPEDLVQYRGWGRDQIAAGVPGEIAFKVFDLVTQDRARGGLRTAQMEKRVASRRLAAQRALLPDGTDEKHTSSLDVGLETLSAMVKDATSPVEGFAVNADSLRTLDDGTSLGIVSLKMNDGSKARKAVVVAPDGEVTLVDSE